MNVSDSFYIICNIVFFLFRLVNNNRCPDMFIRLYEWKFMSMSGAKARQIRKLPNRYENT